ncbi:hypothetical protein GQX74_000878 [Glossina fuscipes]|nr:hypothetical protein GQX74_000878 [Glossina fuscipes]
MSDVCRPQTSTIIIHRFNIFITFVCFVLYALFVGYCVKQQLKGFLNLKEVNYYTNSTTATTTTIATKLPPKDSKSLTQEEISLLFVVQEYTFLSVLRTRVVHMRLIGSLATQDQDHFYSICASTTALQNSTFCFDVFSALKALSARWPFTYSTAATAFAVSTVVAATFVKSLRLHILQTVHCAHQFIQYDKIKRYLIACDCINILFQNIDQNIRTQNKALFINNIKSFKTVLNQALESKLSEVIVPGGSNLGKVSQGFD